MKFLNKTLNRSCTAFCMAAMLILGGCGSRAPGESSSTEELSINGGKVDPGLKYASQELIDAGFALDFRPLLPEPESEAERLPPDSLPSTAGGQVAGGGLRKQLADYKTPYFDREKEAARIAAIQEAQIKALSSVAPVSADPLTVIDWGPRGFFSSTIQRPSVYVVFSEPMIPLAALGAPSGSSAMVRIDPPLKGNFRWYGTGFLSFEAEEPCQAQQTYRITVDPGTVSLSGKKISGETSFSFFTEALAVTRMEPGEEYRNRGMSFSHNGVPPEAAKTVNLYFNYPVTVQDIRPYLALQVQPRSKASVDGTFTLVQENEKKIVLHINDEVGFETTLKITLKQGAKSANSTLGTPEDAVFSFNTPGPFQVLRMETVPAGGADRNILNLYFSERLKVASIQNRIRTEPAMTIGTENLKIFDTHIQIYKLPVNYGDRYRITVDAGVEDIYGRKLEKPYTAEVRVPDAPPPRGNVAFSHSGYYYGGERMLESQFDPRYLFEYTNVTDKSWYRLSTVKNPYRPAFENTRRFTLNTEPNRRWFADMDLKPFLNQKGQGFVHFDANVEYLSYSYNSNGTYTPRTEISKNELVLQVTDLGLTVRAGFNKTIVLVTSLSTGKPLENAVVRLLSRNDIESSGDIRTVRFFAETRTNQEGLALFNFNAGVYNGSIKDGELYAYAEKDEDQAVFRVRGHNTWAFNVYTGSSLSGEAVKPVTFMFTDRGLYKPGEILSFRGIDRSLAVGNYLIYRGKYTVTLEEDSYDGGEAIVVLEGETSESGGFYGTITLPDDLSPQPYRLVYRRAGEKSNASAFIPVTVAFFERLKFEAAITAPAGPLYAGDTIDMELTASYLSGGGLAGAAYEEDWYRYITRYAPPAREAKGYYFGPRDVWDGGKNLSSDTGVLGPGGSAALSRRTVQDSVTGAAYSYTVEARVTDLSNQVISASQTAVVHPARFYLGVAPLWKGGFPRTGQNLSFDFLTLRPSGERSVPADWPAAGQNNLTVEILRDEWHLVQQEGVAGYVYDQYLKKTITEKNQTLRLQDAGSFTFTPSKPGYHTVRLSAQDAEGRKALTEYSFYVTGGGAGYWNMNASSEIRLTPDQAVYNPGDKAQVLLQSALPGGYYLITVEREGIFSEEVKYLDEGTTVLEIPIARNYVPVVYVSVASYSVRKGPPAHEYGSPDLDKPWGYYGVTALNVDPRVKAFTIRIEDAGNRVFKPGETVTLTLKAERNGRPLRDAELTLMAVDRGVLDLINYHVPDPVTYFYNKGNFPLSVTGGDSRFRLIDPVTYSIKNLAGGDSENKSEDRSDFNPTALFEPMLKTGPDGRVKATFKLPDTLTTYRITVVGVQGDLFALKESEIAARNRINVREVLPRRLRERDTAEAGVLITNLDTVPHRVQVSLALSPATGTTNNGLIKTGGGAIIDGVTERSIDLRAGENGVVYFDLAAVKEGYVNLNFTVRSDILNERLINEIYIEKPYVMETFTTLGTVGAGAPSAREGLVIPGWADNGVGNLTVSLDATRLGLLDSAISYLFHYPYGCLEQRSAAILPLVIFGDYIDAFNLRTTVRNPKQVVEDELKSWARVQNSDGGFCYWPNSFTGSNFYVSLRIAHVLALAQKKQYSIPKTLNVENLLSFLNRQIRTAYGQNPGSENNNYHSYLQAYAFYIFSFFGKAGEPSRLAEIAARQDADAGTLAFVGMTYHNLNRKDDAAAIGEKIRNLIRSTTRGVDLSDPRETNSRFYYWYYGNKLEQLALVLEFFVQQYPGDQINGRLLNSLLAQKRAGGYWDSTAVTIRILSAVDALIRADNLEQVDVEGRISLSGTELFRDRYKGLGAKPSGKSFNFKAEPLLSLGRDATLPLTITRSGKGALYYTAALRYAIPSELQSFRDEGLGLFVSYYDAGTGKEAGGNLQSGKTYQARIRLSSGRDRTYVALRVPIPSGAEILDATFVTTSSRYNKALGETIIEPDYDYYGDYWEDPREPSNMMIMDNEVRYFWDSFAKGEVTVQFLFRASRRGVYPTPPVQAECMYEEEIFGRTAGLLYTIE